MAMKEKISIVVILAFGLLVIFAISERKQIPAVADKIIARLRSPVVVGDRELRVTTSIGVAVFPVDGVDDARELMKKADAAMYRAKQAGCDRYAFAAVAASPETLPLGD